MVYLWEPECLGSLMSSSHTLTHHRVLGWLHSHQHLPGNPKEQFLRLQQTHTSLYSDELVLEEVLGVLGNVEKVTPLSGAHLDVSGGPQAVAFCSKVGHCETVTGRPALLSPGHQVWEVVISAAVKEYRHTWTQGAKYLFFMSITSLIHYFRVGLPSDKAFSSRPMAINLGD